MCGRTELQMPFRRVSDLVQNMREELHEGREQLLPELVE